MYKLTYINYNYVNDIVVIGNVIEVWSHLIENVFSTEAVESEIIWHDTFESRYASALLEMKEGSKMVIPYVDDDGDPGAVLIEFEKDIISDDEIEDDEDIEDIKYMEDECSEDYVYGDDTEIPLRIGVDACDGTEIPLRMGVNACDSDDDDEYCKDVLSRIDEYCRDVLSRTARSESDSCTRPCRGCDCDYDCEDYDVDDHYYDDWDYDHDDDLNCL